MCVGEGDGEQIFWAISGIRSFAGLPSLYQTQLALSIRHGVWVGYHRLGGKDIVLDPTQTTHNGPNGKRTHLHICISLAIIYTPNTC